MSSYFLTGDSVDELRAELNMALRDIADRLDKLEGIRGKTSFVGEGLDVTGDVIVKDDDGETIHSME